MKPCALLLGSIGFFCAGLFGAGGMASLGLSPQVHLAIVVLVVVARRVLCFLRKTISRLPRGLSWGGRRPRRGSLVRAWRSWCSSPSPCPAMLMEGAQSRLVGPIYMAHGVVFGPVHSLAGICRHLLLRFSFPSGLRQRFIADAIVEKHSPAVVARILLCVLAAGACAGLLLAGGQRLRWSAFAFIGAGTSVIFPLGHLGGGATHGQGLGDQCGGDLPAVLRRFSLVGPAGARIGLPKIGGIRWIYGLGAPLVALSFLAAGVLGGKTTPARTPKSDQVVVVTL